MVAAEAEAEPEPQVVSAIDAKRLRGVKRGIEDAPFKESKMAVLTDQLQNVRLRTEQVGELIGARAKAEGVTEIVFDRGGNQYHGRVKKLADAVRKQGLKF